MGSWQSKRYFEKVALIDTQMKAIENPGEGLTGNPDIDKRIVYKSSISGKFNHDSECYVGPRGPPPGALAVDGPSSGRGVSC